MTTKQRRDSPSKTSSTKAIDLGGLGVATVTATVSAWSTLTLTNNLRWNHGILEQAWMEVETGKFEWRPVPIYSA